MSKLCLHRLIETHINQSDCAYYLKYGKITKTNPRVFLNFSNTHFQELISGGAYYNNNNNNK